MYYNEADAWGPTEWVPAILVDKAQGIQYATYKPMWTLENWTDYTKDFDRELRKTRFSDY